MDAAKKAEKKVAQELAELKGQLKDQAKDLKLPRFIWNWTAARHFGL